MKTFKCRCGKTLKASGDADIVRCPKCQTALRVRPKVEKWQLRLKNGEYGPYSPEEVVTLIEDSRVSQDALVKHATETVGRWEGVGRIPVFSDAMRKLSNRQPYRPPSAPVKTSHSPISQPVLPAQKPPALAASFSILWVLIGLPLAVILAVSGVWISQYCPIWHGTLSEFAEPWSPARRALISKHCAYLGVAGLVLGTIPSILIAQATATRHHI